MSPVTVAKFQDQGRNPQGPVILSNKESSNEFKLYSLEKALLTDACFSELPLFRSLLLHKT